MYCIAIYIQFLGSAIIFLNCLVIYNELSWRTTSIKTNLIGIKTPSSKWHPCHFYHLPNEPAYPWAFRIDSETH